MATRTLNYYLVKTARLTGWLLFFMVIGYLVTGFTLRGDFGLDRSIGPEVALGIHQLLIWPLAGVFVVHSGLTIYFAMRRWGWIGGRKGRRRAADRAA